MPRLRAPTRLTRPNGRAPPDTARAYTLEHRALPLMSRSNPPPPAMGGMTTLAQPVDAGQG